MGAAGSVPTLRIEQISKAYAQESRRAEHSGCSLPRPKTMEEALALQPPAKGTRERALFDAVRRSALEINAQSQLEIASLVSSFDASLHEIQLSPRAAAPASAAQALTPIADLNSEEVEGVLLMWGVAGEVARQAALRQVGGKELKRLLADPDAAGQVGLPRACPPSSRPQPLPARARLPLSRPPRRASRVRSVAPHCWACLPPPPLTRSDPPATHAPLLPDGTVVQYGPRSPRRASPTPPRNPPLPSAARRLYARGAGPHAFERGCLRGRGRRRAAGAPA